jgi:3-mercaptopyruvate sulfurtransferase SseA
MSQPRLIIAAGCLLLTAAASSFAAAQPPPPVPQPPASAPAVQQAPANPSPESARRIGPAEAREALAKGTAVLVDVRAKESYDAEHAQGAILIPLGDIPARAGELPKDKLIITYCT